MPNRLDDRPPPPPPRSPGRGLARAGVLLVLAAATLELLLAQLSPGAPIRQGFGAETPLAIQARRQAAFVAPIVRLADGRNIELHYAFTDPSPPPAAADLLIAGVYYGINYALAPARAIVGDGRGVINDGPTLRAADRVPSDAWLRAHGVPVVVTVPIDAQGLRRETARLVR